MTTCDRNLYQCRSAAHLWMMETSVSFCFWLINLVKLLLTLPVSPGAGCRVTEAGALWGSWNAKEKIYKSVNKKQLNINWSKILSYKE